MEAISNLDHSELVLRRTVHISNVPENADEDMIRECCGQFGSVERVHFDKADAEDLRMAFVQYTIEDGASSATRSGRLTLMGRSMRISPSRITIDVIPPTDAVFGKPLTVGRHVMAINPSQNRHRAIAKRDAAAESASHAAAGVLEAIATRTGWQVSSDEIKRLRGQTGTPES